MTNIEKLKGVGILGDVRQRMGAEDENDTSKDQHIERLSNQHLIAKYCGWHLGDEGWWNDMYYFFLELEKLNNP